MTFRTKNKNKKKWFDRYLPFVSKSPEMKIKWLEKTFRKGALSLEEVTPYIRLLLSENSYEENERLVEIFADLNKELQYNLLEAADIYDTPKLLRLCPSPDRRHAEIALMKEVPNYEKKKQLILDKVFYAINDFSKELLENSVLKLQEEQKVSRAFMDNYKRFQEILGDEEFLLEMYPKAGGG
ncbi:MAG: hypothetical protein KQH63_07535 [Desulfobulbaceae bacterium]|nr:hypothetical protein [Desulfobulbaceae bacterium]